MSQRELRVLIVEDNPADAELMELELVKGGYLLRLLRVETASAMQAALDSEDWDLILSDYALPRFSGLLALQLLKTSGKDIPFILVSGSAGEEIAVSSMKAGAQDFFVKGNLGLLTSAIQRELREAELRSEQRSLEAQLVQAQKLESLGQLAGGIAHDFNNMLMVIFSRCELMLREVESEKHRRFLGDIRAAAMKNRDLTQQLLAAARRQVLEPQVVSLNDVITSAMQLLGPTLGEHIVIRTELEDSPWNAYADAGKLHQVLLNLAINARDAMPRGGTLTIEGRNVHVDSAYARQHVGLREGDYVTLVVSDTGSGIPREIRERIYDPFFTTKELGRGTGLGLAVVRGIIEQTGGLIWMYSEEGRGTTFRVFLPRYSGDPSPDVVYDEAIPARGRETILMVEDEELLRCVVRETLEEQGYQVIEARAPAEALKISRSFTEPIHLLLTDVIMPGMTGNELAETMVAERSGLRVIFMSGYASHAVMSQTEMPATVRYLEKPILTTVLLRTIRAALDDA